MLLREQPTCLPKTSLFIDMYVSRLSDNNSKVAATGPPPFPSLLARLVTPSPKLLRVYGVALHARGRQGQACEGAKADLEVVAVAAVSRCNNTNKTQNTSTALQGVERLVGSYGAALETSLSVLVPAIAANLCNTSPQLRTLGTLPLGLSASCTAPAPRVACRRACALKAPCLRRPSLAPSLHSCRNRASGGVLSAAPVPAEALTRGVVLGDGSRLAPRLALHLTRPGLACTAPVSPCPLSLSLCDSPCESSFAACALLPCLATTCRSFLTFAHPALPSA